MASLIGPSVAGIIYAVVSVVLLVLLFWFLHRKKALLPPSRTPLCFVLVPGTGSGPGSRPSTRTSGQTCTRSRKWTPRSISSWRTASGTR